MNPEKSITIVKKIIKQHNCFNFDNNKKGYLITYIRMISEGSCDTEN